MNNRKVELFLKKTLPLSIIRKIRHLYETIYPVKGDKNVINIHGNISGLKKTIFGNENVVDINGSTLINTIIRIRGNNNHLIIEDGCVIGDKCSFWLEGNNNRIIIHKHTTMTQHCHFIAQEHNTSIIVGEDCMFSNSINIRTSDSHPIYDKDGNRINPANNVEIGNHIWIAPHSIILKGAIIGNGSIVGSHTMVNKIVPANCLVVGMPSHVVKKDIHWTREDVRK